MKSFDTRTEAQSHPADSVLGQSRGDAAAASWVHGDIIPVIMCGGAGTRLWPASRESMPKQFISLIGELSSFQTTAKRVSGEGFARLVVLATHDVRFIAAEQLQAIGIKADIVLEPARRDSAAAVAVAACLTARQDPNATALILAADHLIPDADRWPDLM